MKAKNVALCYFIGYNAGIVGMNIEKHSNWFWLFAAVVVFSAIAACTTIIRYPPNHRIGGPR